MSILKREDETQFDYIKRITDNRKEYDLDYAEWSRLAIGYECGSDNARKGFYLVKPLLELLATEHMEQLQQSADSSLEEMLDNIRSEKLEMKKERVRWQDERRQYNALVRTEARWDALKDAIIEATELLNNHKPFITKLEASAHPDKVEASLLLSDWHIGVEVDTALNVFNTEVAKERVNELHQKVVHYCKMHGVTKLHVELLGDLISGNIHVSTRLYQQENVVEQTKLCAEMIAEFIDALSNEIEEIEIHFTVGNHGRTTPNYKEHIDEENFEYLILWHLETRLGKVENVAFNKNKKDNEIIVYQAGGRTIACAHGHKEKKAFDSVKTLSHFLGIDIDECHLGHFHNVAMQNNVFVNGCLSGVDQYAQSLRFNNKPAQVLRVYHEDDTSCTYEIVLNK